MPVIRQRLYAHPVLSIMLLNIRNVTWKALFLDSKKHFIKSRVDLNCFKTYLGQKWLEDSQLSLKH